ncbi:MAG TPA: Ig-like domain-containing protein, partial [Patescibacteria group bacterium]|nr:Ig-like domain-containing protein [Patescibacteria group bacterium]
AVIAGGDEQCADESGCSNPMDFVVSCDNNFDCNTGCCSDSGICRDASFCNTCVDDEACQEGGACANSTCSGGVCTPVVTGAYSDSGPPGSSTTIGGCHFGSYVSGNSAVSFAGVNANLFCSDGWSNNEIIAEVPSVLQKNTKANVVVTDSAKVKSPEWSAFSVTDTCAGGIAVPSTGFPLLCDIAPGSGVPKDEKMAIAFLGDRYVNTDQKNVFFDNQSGENFLFENAQKTTVTVPEKASSGLAAPVVAQCTGNALNFGIECSTTDECAEGYYCVDGICTDDAAEECTVGNQDNACHTGEVCTPNGQCVTQPKFLSSSPAHEAIDVCPNVKMEVKFSEAMKNFEGNILLDQVTFESDGSVQSANPVSISIDSNNKKTIYISPNSAVQTTSAYRLTILSENNAGLLSEANNVSLEGGTKIITFTTADNICEPAEVELLSDETGNPYYTFTSAGSTTPFTAYTYSSISENHQLLQSTDEMNWEYTWSPYDDENLCSRVAWVDISAPADEEVFPSATAETQTIISGEENGGTTSIKVVATAITGWSGSLEANATVDVFFCEQDKLWEYVDWKTDDPSDIEQNFRLIYCATNADSKLSTTPSITSGGIGQHSRQYLFSNPNNPEQAFGVRVYDNTEKLPPESWYKNNVPNPGSPASIEIDGYKAVRDNLTYYISASNIFGTDLANNMYLFTFNNEESFAGTADEIIQNIRFNMNMDFSDCNASDKSKLTRDTVRLNDMYGTAETIETYYDKNGTYPLPKSESFGSYIDVLTVSVWPSWQGALGNILGQTVPTDPYNFFYASSEDMPWDVDGTPWIDESDKVADCKNEPDKNIYFDESGTCWDSVNNHFFCPANSYIYAWKAVRSNPNKPQQIDRGYLYANFEYASSKTETYRNMSQGIDACDDITQAECACFDYMLELPLTP